MKQYNNILEKILKEGVDAKTRNATTRSLFAIQMRFKMEDGFPAVTTKKLAFRSVAGELFWFLSGCNDNKELQKVGCNIWTANTEADYWKPKAKFNGDLGRIYGVQWRNWQGPNGKVVDQIKEVIEKIKKDPNDRRLIITAWNPGELEQMALPPCHMIFQFYVKEKKISLHMLQRSCDMFLGVPFNIASYALLLHIIAQITNNKAHELILTLNDAHIYHEHFDAVKEQLSRTPKKLPALWLNPEIKNIEDLNIKNFNEPNDIYKMVKLEDYDPYPSIKAEMIV